MVSTIDLCAAALAYAAAGFRVFPLRGKLPWIAKADGGHGVHDATTNPDLIREWWRRFPTANIGLAAGTFWALDVDPRHGGDATLARLETQHGALPATAKQITGTGGRHILFQPNPAVGNRAGERHGLPPGLDTRSVGGYIVAAPSIHPDTLNRYRWRDGHHPLEHPLAVAPAWLVALVAPRPEPAPPRPVASQVSQVSQSGSRYGEAALRAEVEAVRSAPPGSRNAVLNRAAFSLATLAAAGAIDLAAVGRALAEAALAAGLSPREIERTLASGMRAGLSRPREIL